MKTFCIFSQHSKEKPVGIKGQEEPEIGSVAVSVNL